jgi:hypothetical protein
MKLDFWKAFAIACMIIVCIITYYYVRVNRYYYDNHPTNYSASTVGYTIDIFDKITGKIHSYKRDYVGHSRSYAIFHFDKKGLLKIETQETEKIN